MAPQNFEFVAVEPPSQPPPATGRAYKKMRWESYTPGNVPGATKPAMKARSVASDIPLDKLKISAEQRAAIDDLYRQTATDGSIDRLPVDHLFRLDADDQLNAAAVMAQHGLDLDAREHLSNRWAQQWARVGGGEKTSKDNADNARKILYLCDCGYDHARNQSKQRKTPVPFTGCLAHAEVTYVVGSEKILRIRGYFENNQACKDAVFTRIPPIPVHPSVFAVALAQLRDGTTFTDVKKKNRELFDAGNYTGFPADLENSPYRWLIETRDSRSLLPSIQSFERCQSHRETSDQYRRMA